MAAIASAQIIHVPADQPNIQAGIDAALDGDTVLVAEGTYYENIRFKGKAITLGSEYIMDADTNHIHNTIINGSQPVNADSASAVMFISGEDTTSVINGFTITKGQGTWSNVTHAHAGGGIFCFNAGAKIVRCNITGNELLHDNYALGAGISSMTTNGDFSIIIENNSISDNVISVTNTMAGGGGIFIGATTPAATINARIALNKFENNYCECGGRADGGGVKTELATMAAGTFHIIGNTFLNNSIKGSSTRGGGLCGIGTGGIITNNIFRYNYIDENSGQFRGAAIAYKTSSTDIEITGNLFIENISPINTTDASGAVSIMDSWENRVIIDRNFFLNNEAKVGAGLFVRRGYNLLVTNNVFYGNSAEYGGVMNLYNPDTDKGLNNAGRTYLRAGIINNTFAFNTASYEGGVLRFVGTHTPPIIFNSIFWGNTAPNGPDIINSTEEKIVIYYTLINETEISGVWTGEHNINEDPLLEPGDSLCHINGGPCQDAGIDELEVVGVIYPAPDIDYEGTPRPQGQYWDIGADECIMVGIPKIVGEESAFNLKVNPNPTSGAVHLRYSILDTRYLILEIYSSDGVKAKTLFAGKQQAGEHKMHFNLSNLPNGIYVLRLQAGEQVETEKVVLIK